MGQLTSKRHCTCACGACPTDIGRLPASLSGISSVHRYVTAVTERCAACPCRRSRWQVLTRRPREPCECEATMRSLRESATRAASAGTGAAAATEPRRPVLAFRPNCSACRDDRLAETALRAFSTFSAELQGEPYALVGISAASRVSGEAEGGAAEAAGGGELLLWSVSPQGVPNFANLDPEDLEEHARARRALEIAQGVEPPPGYQPRLQVVCNGELRAVLLRAPAAQVSTLMPVTRVHTQVDYIHCLVPDLKEITACCYYWGKMDRYEAERLLDNKPEGTFLLRDSAQEEHLFSVSFRKYGRSLHARIEHFNHKFSFDSHDPAVFSAPTVTTLIHHYKDPACVMFFEPMLTAPLPRTAPFTLQQLARAVIVSSTTYDGVEELPVPPRLRAYLKEYHYRQRVRVRRLDSLACLHAPDAPA